MTQHAQSICLCMIVKNEAAVIRRCIDSVRQLITHWIIVDTGSTDGTQNIIRECLRDLPGELYERPWRDFAHNRSEALALARPRAQYSLVIDADDTLELPADYRLPILDCDAYQLEIRDTPLLYWRTQLVNNRLEWRYRGVLHEFMTCDKQHSLAVLPIGMRRNHDGARRKDPSWFDKDVQLLENALRDESDPFLRARYIFYLAQSYRDSRSPALALKYYRERSSLGFWQEEVFVSLYHVAKLMEELGYPDEEVLAAYDAATRSNPARIEARHGASRLCRLRGLNARGYDVAKPGLGQRVPTDALFAETWIYDFGLADEFAVNAYWAKDYGASIEANLGLLQGGRLPSSEQGRVIANLRASWEAVAQSRPALNLGALGAEDFFKQHGTRDSSQPPVQLKAPPRVLLAILAKQKEGTLGLYLECIDNLDYPKSSIVVYIRTNNNRDNTEWLLRHWVTRVGDQYAAVMIDSTDVEERVQDFGVHEWNETRFKVLARIRQASLQKAQELRCDFYFCCDVDNFIRPDTLKSLVALNLPVVAPFLRSIEPERYYSNFHAEVDANGYYAECDQYHWIVNRWVRGVLKVPVIHCTYLIRSDVIPFLAYSDGSPRHEYVIFSALARAAGIPQYIDNRNVYGYITFDRGEPAALRRDVDRARSLIFGGQDPNGIFAAMRGVAAE